MGIRTRKALLALIAIVACFDVQAADGSEPPSTDQNDPDSGQPLTWLKARDYASLDRYYSELQREYESSSANDQKLYSGFRKLYENSAANEQYFDAWVEAFPTSYSARMARGAYLYRMAWFVRGDGYLYQISRKQIAQMSQYLARAQPDLLASMKLTEKPYLSTLYLLNVASLEGSADERRHWFEEGTAIDPGNSLVRTRYMLSLRPRWGGSYPQMQQFLRECEQKHLDPRLLAKLSMLIHEDMAEAAREEGSTAEAFTEWEQVIKLAEAAGEEPSTEALAHYTRGAWDLNRRADADRGLEQLAKRTINDSWILENIGYVYVKEHRDAQAWPYLLKAAQLNEPWSQFAVGQTIYLGCPDINLARDPAAGLVWIRRSADQCFEGAVTFLSSHGDPARTDCKRQAQQVDELPEPLFHLVASLFTWIAGGALTSVILGWVAIKWRQARNNRRLEP